MALFSSSWFLDFAIILTSASIIIYIYFKKRYRYWKERNVFYLEPKFFFGNFKDLNRSKTFGEVVMDAYSKSVGYDFVGVWMYNRPLFIPRNLELVKNILVRDFNFFHDRGIPVDEEVEPLSGHLVNMAGKKWKNLRTKLTPTFTSGKMKMMFPNMVKCGEDLRSYLKGPAEETKVIEMKDVLARFTTDIISSCAFGIESNSLRDPNSEFRKWGKKVFEPSLKVILMNRLAFLVPPLKRLLKIKRFPADVTEFFMSTVKDTIDYRRKNKEKRNDFMQLLIELIDKGQIEDVMRRKETQTETESSQKFTVEQAAAQAFVFFLAGFETSSTTMMFCLYELSLNPQIQKRLQQEIDNMLQKYENKITYEAVQEMEYLDRVVSEALRKYPPIPVHIRECSQDYKVLDTDVIIPKGMRVFVPVLGIHRDEEYFPKPEVFDPDRFLKEEKAKRHNFAYIPFGEGPRVCIGERFGVLQTKIGLIVILSSYNVYISSESPIPIVYSRKSLILSPEKGMKLRISKRRSATSLNNLPESNSKE